MILLERATPSVFWKGFIRQQIVVNNALVIKLSATKFGRDPKSMLANFATTLNLRISESLRKLEKQGLQPVKFSLNFRRAAP